MEVPKLDGLYGKTLLKWMMTGGTPIYGNLHMYIYIHIHIHWKNSSSHLTFTHFFFRLRSAGPQLLCFAWLGSGWPPRYKKKGL